MKTVEPIRDVKKLNKMKRYLKRNNIRDYALFTLGINSALRASDLLKLKVKDVSKNGKVLGFIEVQEQKTGKNKRFNLSDKATKALREYLKTVDLNPDDPLFISRKTKEGKPKPITRQHFHELLKRAAEHAKIDEPISTHSCRKTWGYHAYQNGAPLPLIMVALNHSSERETLRYIGITQDEIRNIYKSVNL